MRVDKGQTVCPYVHEAVRILAFIAFACSTSKYFKQYVVMDRAKFIYCGQHNKTLEDMMEENKER